MLTDMQIPIVPVSDGTTQRLIANIQENTVANQDYYKGDQFILNGVLYKVTKANGGTVSVPTPAIAQGVTIDIANDCAVSDTIAQQINDISVTHYIKQFPNTRSLSIPFRVSHNIIWMGTLGNVGNVVLGMYVNSTGNITVKDLYTGDNYTNSNLAVSYSSNVLTFTFGVNSSGLLISDGVAIN